MTRLIVTFCLALTACLASTGCQSLTPRTTTTTTTSTQEPGGPKTEFHREVGPEQEYSVHMELARFQESQGNHEAAVIEYQKAVDVCERKGSLLSHSKLGAEKQSLAQRRMAAALDRLGRFAQAEPHYLKALKLAPNDAKVWNDAGYSYYLQHRLADAERALKTASKLDANNPRILTNLGLTLAAAGKNDDALVAFTRAAGPAAGHANLGYILAAMGKSDLAREHYQLAVTLQPQLTAAHQALAKLDHDHPPATTTATAIAAVSRPVNPKDPQITRTTKTVAKTNQPPKPAPSFPLPPLPGR